jgi:pentatricopeptide repeat protein
MPQDATVAEHLADAYAKQKRYQDALRLYKKAQGLENPNPRELKNKINKLEAIQGAPNP